MSAESLDRIPRPMIVAVGIMLLAILAGTAALRVGDVPPIAQGPALGEAELRLPVRLAPLDGGGVAILDPGTGREHARLAPGEDGFMRGLLRVLDRERMLHGVPSEGPVEILRWPGGHLALRDPATEWRAELIGFGADNFAAFATLVSEIVDTREDAE